MNSSIGSTLLFALLVYAGCSLFLYIAQRGFIYFPTPEVSNPTARDLRIDSGGETIQVWQLNPGGSQAILYIGGNAEDVSNNTPDFLKLFGDYTVYLVNYRGYGASTGSPSEAGLFADAEAVYDFIATEHARVHVMGRSLGSGIAVHLASVRDVGKLVLVTPYDSIANIAAKSMPIFPVKLMLKDRYESWRLAGDLKNPTLALLAEYDQVIPRASSERLIAAFEPGQVTVVVVPRADHNSIGMMPEYQSALAAFMER